MPRQQVGWDWVRIRVRIRVRVGVAVGTGISSHVSGVSVSMVYLTKYESYLHCCEVCRCSMSPCMAMRACVHTHSRCCSSYVIHRTSIAPTIGSS